MVAAATSFAMALVASATPAPLIGFTDEAAYQRGADDRRAAIAHTRSAGGSVVRVVLNWSDVAPRRPPGPREARNPSWPGYRWATLDPVVRDLASAGLRPLVTVVKAPPWAEAGDRPPDAPAGSWRPSAAAFRDFAEALARRYPRVRHWQPWNEPNLPEFLSPQWSGPDSAPRAVSPVLYRRLLRAFYAGVKAVSPHNRVISAGTAPYGDPRPGGARIPPALFTRELLCVSGRERPRARPCPGGPPAFDALAHHPFAIGEPERTAGNPDDVSVADLHKLTDPLEAALGAGTVHPAGPKQLWITELSWDSSPPDPEGVPAGLHARYVEGALHLLWRQGADAVVWHLLRDEPVGQGYAFGLQSGVFFRSARVSEDRPKPAFAAIRFPFVTTGATHLWGLAPRGGEPVAIEVEREGGWRPLRVVRARRDRLFSAAAKVRPGNRIRARQGARVSLPWTPR